MKILMLASGTIHSSLSNRMLALAREFVRAGHQVTIIAPARDKYSEFKSDNEKSIDGIDLVYPFQFKTSSFVLNLVPYLLSCLGHALRAKADVVYICKPTPITVTGLFAKWAKRTPVIADFDDLGSEVMKIERQPWIIYSLVAACERLVARNADGIVAASTLLHREYHEKYPTKPIIRVPNGVDPKEFVVTPPRHEPHIIFIGAFNRTQIIQPLIEALPEVIKATPDQSVHLDFHGDGMYRQHFEDRTKELGITKNVTFYGWTNHSDLPKYAAKGDLGICAMPNNRTTIACSNQKLFEYMAMGLCVVASNVGDLPGYLNNGESGVIVESLDSGLMAEALIDLLRDSKKRQNLASNARIQAETTYSWETLAGQSIALISKVTGATK
jgi:glycosyltransferase involved in cell wall biosynthesis